MVLRTLQYIPLHVLAQLFWEYISACATNVIFQRKCSASYIQASFSPWCIYMCLHGWTLCTVHPCKHMTCIIHIWQGDSMHGVSDAGPIIYYRLRLLQVKDTCSLVPSLSPHTCTQSKGHTWKLHMHRGESLGPRLYRTHGVIDCLGRYGRREGQKECDGECECRPCIMGVSSLQ